MTGKIDIWHELAEEITKELKNPKKLFPYHRKDLVGDVERVIKKFAENRIVQFWFKVKKNGDTFKTG